MQLKSVNYKKKKKKSNKWKKLTCSPITSEYDVKKQRDGWRGICLVPKSENIKSKDEEVKRVKRSLTDWVFQSQNTQNIVFWWFYDSSDRCNESIFKLHLKISYISGSKIPLKMM